MTTDDLLRTAMTIDDELDELSRARMWAQLEPRLAVAAPRSRVHRSIAIGLGLAAAAAAAILVLVHRDATPASFVAPRDTTLSLHVDDHTRAVLVGPAQLDPIEHSATTTVVRLRSGTLLAEFEGGQGRSLRILTPGAVVEIVGTLFAVEAMHDHTCVSVSHGTVKMTSSGRVQTIATGERACTDQIAMEPIAPAMREALAQHETPTAAVAHPIITPLPPEPPPAVAEISTNAAPRIAAPTHPLAAPPPTTPPPTPTPTPARAREAIEPAPVVVDQPPAPVQPVAPPVQPIAPPVTEPQVVPPQPRAPAPQPVARPHVDADALYAEAERDLGARNVAAADRNLARLVYEFPTSSLIDQAYYERARIAFDRHAWKAASSYLDKLAQLTASPLAEPGSYLACRIAVEARDAAAAACFAKYRATYSRSPHDEDALGAIVDLEDRAGGCSRARASIDELEKRYPTSLLAARWSTKCP